MPTETSDETQAVMSYPSVEQHEQWKVRADEMGMSLSGFVQAMVEAGWKKFDGDVRPDETKRELREQRRDLKGELDHARERIATLEETLHHGEQAALQKYIDENPGADYREIVEHLAKTVPERARRHLDTMEGESVRVEDGQYYALES